MPRPKAHPAPAPARVATDTPSGRRLRMRQCQRFHQALKDETLIETQPRPPKGTPKKTTKLLSDKVGLTATLLRIEGFPDVVRRIAEIAPLKGEDGEEIVDEELWPEGWGAKKGSFTTSWTAIRGWAENWSEEEEKTETETETALTSTRVSVEPDVGLSSVEQSSVASSVPDVRAEAVSTVISTPKPAAVPEITPRTRATFFPIPKPASASASTIKLPTRAAAFDFSNFTSTSIFENNKGTLP